MSTLDAFAAAKLARLEAQSLRRDLAPTHRLPGALARRAGQTLVSFSCNDYLGLSRHPRVEAAAKQAIDEWGAGAGASRLVTGDTSLAHRLEAELARLKGAEAALVFGSGYLANVGIAPTLVGAGDLVALDELSHACMFAGARLSGATVATFAHNDPRDLDRVLQARRGGRALALTETVFSMDGDLAPIDDLLAVCARGDAWLITDDAHGFGLVAPQARAPLQMGTLSKAVGVYGGYLCGSRAVIDLMKNRARSFVYTTGLPPACLAAALAALEIMQAEPERGARALTLAQRFSRALGLPAAQSAIVPVIVGEAQAALRMSQQLEERGFLVVAIRPPTVPAGTARLRVAFSAAHDETQVDALIAAMRDLAPSICGAAP